VVVVVWIADGVWPAAVDAARAMATPDADFVLVHVTPGDVEEVVHGAFAGLFGRGLSAPAAVDQAAAAGANDLLEAAAARLGRPVCCQARQGRIEREVVAAAEHADLLVISRDGDRTRLGPHSLGPVSRFVVDHAPCAVLLVWPGSAPAVGTIPAPPRRPPVPPRGTPGPHPQ